MTSRTKNLQDIERAIGGIRESIESEVALATLERLFKHAERPGLGLYPDRAQAIQDAWSRPLLQAALECGQVAASAALERFLFNPELLMLLAKQARGQSGRKARANVKAPHRKPTPMWKSEATRIIKSGLRNKCDVDNDTIIERLLSAGVILVEPDGSILEWSDETKIYGSTKDFKAELSRIRSGVKAERRSRKPA